MYFTVVYNVIVVVRVTLVAMVMLLKVSVMILFKCNWMGTIEA